MKTLFLMAIVCIACFTSCQKEDLPKPPLNNDNTFQIRIESVGINDSITYSPIIVIR